MIFAIHSLFLGGKRKREKNNQSRGQKSYLSSRSALIHSFKLIFPNFVLYVIETALYLNTVKLHEISYTCRTRKTHKRFLSSLTNGPGPISTFKLHKIIDK